ncbi:hypothetical protein ACSSS7_003927 [Eimeria intestinalis]
MRFTSSALSLSLAQQQSSSRSSSGSSGSSSSSRSSQRERERTTAQVDRRLLSSDSSSQIALPPSVDWRTKGCVTPPKDQGQCGSCWAFSTTGAVEGAWCTRNGRLFDLSEQMLMDCSRYLGNNGCNGGLMDDAFTYVTQKGLCLEKDYPYEAKDSKCRETRCKPAVRIKGFYDVPAGEETAMRRALAEHGPVSVAIQADQVDFQFYKSGVFDAPCGSSLDHGVLLVGRGAPRPPPVTTAAYDTAAPAAPPPAAAAAAASAAVRQRTQAAQQGQQPLADQQQQQQQQFVDQQHQQHQQQQQQQQQQKMQHQREEEETPQRALSVSLPSSQRSYRGTPQQATCTSQQQQLATPAPAAAAAAGAAAGAAGAAQRDEVEGFGIRDYFVVLLLLHDCLLPLCLQGAPSPQGGPSCSPGGPSPAVFVVSEGDVQKNPIFFIGEQRRPLKRAVKGIKSTRTINRLVFKQQQQQQQPQPQQQQDQQQQQQQQQQWQQQ